jgi:transcriptional regulator
MVYIPKHFVETDVPRLHALISTCNFSTLICVRQGDIQVSHLPLLLDARRNVLRGHMARANPQWRMFSPQQEVLAVFHGPHHYVSPRWYASHPSVPTWNYAVVHAHGRPRLIDDAGSVEPLVRDLAVRHEAGAAHPWVMDLPGDYQEKMLAAIVGFEIEITRLEGKFKLSQNRPAGDRPLVIAALEQLGNDNARGVAAMMREAQSDD